MAEALSSHGGFVGLLIILNAFLRTCLALSCTRDFCLCLWSTRAFVHSMLIIIIINTNHIISLTKLHTSPSELGLPQPEFSSEMAVGMKECLYLLVSNLNLE